MREPLAVRIPIGRSVILLIVAFVIGTGIGWIISRPFAHTPNQPVSDVDYVAVVAQLFQRDHNEAIARERLALLGSPSVLVQQALEAVQNGTVKDQSDQAALRSLAQAIAPGAVAAAPSPAAATAATPAGQATTAASPSERTGATGPASRSSLIGPLIAFVLAFSLGALVLLRTAGLSLPLASLSSSLARGLAARQAAAPSAARPTTDGFAVAPSAGPAPLRRLRHVAPSPALDEDVVDEEQEGRSNAHREDAQDSPVPLAASLGRTATLSRPRTTVARPGRRLSFQSVYRHGDDPYDEIHPITDPTTGALVAACGLSAALRPDGSVLNRYCAFIAWVQDYVSGEQLRAVGLVAPAAMKREVTALEDWVREGEIDEVVAATPGARAELRTDSLTATVTVVAVDHGGDPSESTFGGLTVRFDVRCDGAMADV